MSVTRKLSRTRKAASVLEGKGKPHQLLAWNQSSMAAGTGSGAPSSLLCWRTPWGQLPPPLKRGLWAVSDCRLAKTLNHVGGPLTDANFVLLGAEDALTVFGS